jgi:hypothetical protein
MIHSRVNLVNRMLNYSFLAEWGRVPESVFVLSWNDDEKGELQLLSRLHGQHARELARCLL